MAVESPSAILVFDQGDGGLLRPRIFRVVLPSGSRTLISDFANTSQGTFTGGSGYGPNALVMGPPGWAYIVVGSLYRIDLATGQRFLVSNLSDATQGDTLEYVTGLAVHGSGDILFVGSRTRAAVLAQKLYRVNPSSGQRVGIADLKVIAPTALLFQGLAVEPSGSVVAVDTLSGAWRVNPSTGSGNLLSDFGNPTQGPSLGMVPWTVAVNSAGSIFVGAWNTFRAAGRTYFQGAVIRVDSVTGTRTVLSDFGNSIHGPNIEGTIPDLDVVVGGSSPPSSLGLTLAMGGVVTSSTTGTATNVQSGYATVAVNAGVHPYGTAVFSLYQNGVVVSEAGVPASPPTQGARIFIDYRTGVSAGIGTLDIYTGFAIAHRGSSSADITYTLRNQNAQTLAIGHGSLAAGAHFAKFIHQLRDVAPDFDLPLNFSTATLFGSLEITSTQPVSIVALRLTTNQRGETLLTSTPIADLSVPPTNSPAYFPHLADGGGYRTGLILLNTSTDLEAGTVEIFDDTGAPLPLREAGGSTASSFPYSIPAGGTFVFQSDGSSIEPRVGWVRLTAHVGRTPVGAGIFSYSPAGILVTESGIPSAAPTTLARIYVDKSGGHDTGLAIANPAASEGRIILQPFETNGSTPAGDGDAVLTIPSNGHSAKFVSQLIGGLPAGFTGVLQIASTTPFVALTLRSLSNTRGDFLLTTFPIADANQPAPTPIVFPQIADGGGYGTQFIFISPSGSATITVNIMGDDGSPLNLPVTP
jgi:hypothetical protein